jgi:hypothetical protein
MNKKMMLLALAAVSAAMFALPAVASAGAPEVECGGVVCGNFTAHGGTGTLASTNGLAVECTGNTAEGKYETKTTGSIKLVFTGCRDEIFNVPCSNTATSGKIETTVLSFHSIYTTDNKTTPGTLVTPNGTHFATFTCGFKFEVTGNGIIGSLTSPACGKASKSYTLSFTQASKGHQTHKQITGTGTIYDLNTNGSTSSQVSVGTVTFGSEATLTCV